jgi:glycosyltransferase involved in cell wall biosynthesis/SAM-dependent methyltransferase
LPAVDACTIVARRELARARVLVDSLRVHHPDAACLVVLLDGVEGAEQIDGATVMNAEELVGEARLGTLAAGNTLEGLTAALLPDVVRRALSQRESGGPVLYLGAGLCVLGPLHELEALAGEHELCVVSRALSGAHGGGTAFEQREGGGAISPHVLGCTGGQATEWLLERWPSYFAGAQALYDWFDGLPALAEDVGVLREPGYGLDEWTLSAERVQDGAGRVQGGAGRADGHGELIVEGRRARLIDFSSLDPAAPERPNHARRQARLHSIEALTELRRHHAEQLLAAGYEQDASRHYRFGALGDGTPMTDTMHKLWREGVEEGSLSIAPFTQAGREAFYAYLNEPAERGAAAGLSRLHLAIWALRPDVQAAFPHLDGPDGPRFASWLCEHAAEDHHVPAALLPTQAQAPQGPHLGEIDVTEPLWGVNVAGFFTAELGLGEAARLLIAGLDARSIPALPVQARLVPPCGQGAEFAYASPQDAPYPISIVCINGDLVGPFAREVGDSFFAGRHTIALWWWEVGQFPDDWAAAFEHVDEVWVGSQHIHDAVAPAAPVPVVKMTMPVALPRVPQRSRAELGLPEEGFLFLYVHDYHSTASRKNPVGVVEAFKRAFPRGSGAKLVVKSINAENVMHEHDRVRLAAAGHPDVTLIDAYVSASDKNAMIAACDCYVSLHRSEGFGLTAAEAMLLGKPVIATRYGGNLEFMTEENSYLVDWVPVKVGENAHPYPADGVWADPDLDQAAALMREVLADPQSARERGERGRREVAERHSPGVAGEQMEARLRILYERMVAEGKRSLNLAHRPAPANGDLPALIAGAEPTGGSGARAKLRRIRRRVLRPLTHRLRARQRAVDSRLLDDVRRLEQRLYDVTQELVAREEAHVAQTLAMGRRLGAELRDVQTLADALERIDAGALLDELQQMQPGPRLAALEELGRQVEHHLAQHRATPYVSEERGFGSWREEPVGPVVGYRAGTAGGEEREYIDFEATFRGPEERVREIQRAYMPLLEGHGPVLDVGCGRGELLDLLAEAGVAASGVDLDAGMAAHAQAKGHEVALGDGVEFLRGIEPSSLGAVVAIEVIEHLPYERLTEFLRLARSRIRPGGVLLLETVNPHAVDAMKAFWIDPTHQHPLFPEVVLELCRLAGFEQALWFHPLGDGQFEEDRETQPIYAVAAKASV